MKKRYLTTAVVGAVFVALMAWVLLQERGRVPEKGEYLGLQLADIGQLQVQAKDHRYTLVRRGQEWWITEPFEGLASPDAAKRVVQAVASLRAVAREGKNLQDPEYGLAQPTLTVTVTYKGKRSLTIRLGEKSALGDKFFATLSDKPTTLFLVDQMFSSDLDQPAENLREKKLVADLKTDNTKQISLLRTGEAVTVALVPLAKETTWRITAPRALPADRSAVESVITALSGAEALDFLPYTHENLAATGLNEPQVSATFTLQGSAPVTVYLGKQEKRSVKSLPTAHPKEEEVVFATRSGRPEILAMRASLLADLNKGLLELRDKHIFADLKREQISSVRVQREQGLSFSVMKVGQEWQVTAPKTGKAKSYKVDDVLFSVTDLQALAYPTEGDSAVDLEKYGLKLPQAALTLGVEGRAQPLTLWIGAVVPNEVGRYYARTSLRNEVYEIDSALLHNLPQSVDDLLEPAATSAKAGASPGPGGPAHP